MDTKRLIIALALSMVVILVYQHFFMPKPKPRPPQAQEQAQEPEQQEVQSGTQESVNTEEGSAASPQNLDIFSRKQQPEETEAAKPAEFESVQESLRDQESKEIVVETGLFRAVLTNKGAGLKSFVLKKYNDDAKQPMDLISSKTNIKFGPHEIYPFYFSPFGVKEQSKDLFLELNRQNFLYEGELSVNLMNSQEPNREIVFKYADVERNLSVIKRFIFSDASYVFEVKYQIIKDGKLMEDAPLIFGPDLENNISKNRLMQSTLKVGVYNGQEVKTVNYSKLKPTGEAGDPVQEASGGLGSGFQWAVYDTNYFAAIFKTRGQVNYTLLKMNPANAKDKESSPELLSYVTFTKPDMIYLGPKDEQILGAVEKTYQFDGIPRVVDYGWSFIGSIASIMLKCIVFIYGFVPNYGWALVIFTIFIKILLFPLTYTSSVSMAKMQALQPKLKAIRKKYKNLKDPEQRRRMNEETMAIYKQEKVNPAGGCLPMLLQMPILFAFFRLLPISINFRHEPWILWITDLSVKDPIYLLPILMGATQIVVSKMSPTSAEGAQKKMMYIMPVIFVVLFMNYSAGLNLYWFVSNLLQIGQQYIINEKIFKEKKEEDRLRRALKRKKGGKAR
jgi:YidC/Oxa1 family membrane protein insertase